LIKIYSARNGHAPRLIFVFTIT
jgi:hypothetical protein